VSGRLWNFRLSRESSTTARLSGRLDVSNLIDRPKERFIIITPNWREEQEKEKKQLARERQELKQTVDFGVFEKLE
jgi:hypothetical protein